MEIIISNNTSKPIYEQITGQIKQMIMSGELKAGESIPSMRALAKSLHISVITVQRAYEDLQKDGFIETTVGKGSFVSAFNRDFVQEEKQRQLDIRYIRMARIWSENSYCVRRQVGALIVKDKMIISDGYNGTPSGFENVCEDDMGKTKPYVLHAEANAITKVAKSANSSEGATLYVTASPCIECAKLIIQAGIIRIVYCDDYHSEDGLELLRKVGIETVKIPAEECEK